MSQCDSKYMTKDNQVVSCEFTVHHRIHEGKLGEEWFTWRTEHEMSTKPYWIPPKEELPKCRSRYQDKSNGDFVMCSVLGDHVRHRGGQFSWPDEDAYVEGTESTSPSMKQIGGAHYKGKNELQPIDVVDKWGLDFYEGSALKYLARHRQKNGAEDIRKAIHYLELLLERQYPNAV